MGNGAKLNSDRTRRRLLWRTWAVKGEAISSCCFICLNPSTADENKNDHSVRKMIGFSGILGYNALVVVNLFDIRTTYPSELYGRDLSVLNTTANDAEIVKAASAAKTVIAGWGGHGVLLDRDMHVMKMLERAKVVPRALKINDDGTPAHPLRLPYRLKPIVYIGRQYA